MSKSNNKKGFTAVISVLLLSLGTLALCLATLTGSVWYADAIHAREVRIQKNLNRLACEETIQFMAAKNYFLSGEVVVDRFRCRALVTNDFNGNISIRILSVKL